jgi:hypothetical protein
MHLGGVGMRRLFAIAAKDLPEMHLPCNKAAIIVF